MSGFKKKLKKIKWGSKVVDTFIVNQSKLTEWLYYTPKNLFAGNVIQNKWRTQSLFIS